MGSVSPAGRRFSSVEKGLIPPIDDRLCGRLVVHIPRAGENFRENMRARRRVPAVFAMLLNETEPVPARRKRRTGKKARGKPCQPFEIGSRKIEQGRVLPFHPDRFDRMENRLFILRGTARAQDVELVIYQSKEVFSFS